MNYFAFSLIFFSLISLSGGCSSKKEYDNATDRIIIDLDAEVEMLESYSKQITEDLEKVRKLIKDPDYDLELRASLKTELHEGEYWEKKIFNHVAYRKIRKRQRIELLDKRKSLKLDYADVASKECDDYFINKRLNPLKKGWETRYRAAVDL